VGNSKGEKGVYFWFFRVTQMSPGKHLISLLSAIEDPRVVGRTWHKLIDVLSIALFSVLAGA